jgi:hypothetical protein
LSGAEAETYRRRVRVTFRRTHRRGYAVDIARDHGENLTMDPAPGYDDLLPHDLVHLLVELHWGLRAGIFGDVAAGGNAGTFRLADDRPAEESAREWARKARRARRRKGGSDMPRSEHLASLVHARWRARQHGTALPDWYAHKAAAADATEAEIESALLEAEAISARWRTVQVGHGMTVDWPERGSSDTAAPGRNRRSERRRELAREA